MLLVAPVVENRRIVPTPEQQALWGIDLLNVPKSDIPAATHVDYSARIQTVHEDTNPRYYRLLKAFEAKTACGLLVNTSFNVRSEPIVCHLKTPIAVSCAPLSKFWCSRTVCSTRLTRSLWKMIPTGKMSSNWTKTVCSKQ